VGRSETDGRLAVPCHQAETMNGSGSASGRAGPWASGMEGMLAAGSARAFAAEAPGHGEAAAGRAPVIFVCSPRPRVGKTLVARLLVEFFLANHRRALAFDANPNDPALSEYLPAEPATIADTPGQMALFDRLIVNDGTPKVVDLAADQFERLVAVLPE